MRTIKILMFVLMQFAVFVSCSNNKIENELLSTELNSILKIWSFENEVVVEKVAEGVKINIFFKGNNSNAFFLDDESNDLIVSMVNYRFYKELVIYDKIYYQLKFEGYPDVRYLNFEKYSLKNNYNQFEDVPLFSDFVEYSFVNMGYKQVLKSTQTIKNYNKIIPDIYSYNGTFWTLLHDYSKACKEPKKNVKNLYHFLVLAIDTSNPSYKNEYINRDAFKYFLKVGGFESSLLDMKITDMTTYVYEKYGD